MEPGHPMTSETGLFGFRDRPRGQPRGVLCRESAFAQGWQGRYLGVAVVLALLGLIWDSANRLARMLWLRYLGHRSPRSSRSLLVTALLCRSRISRCWVQTTGSDPTHGRPPRVHHARAIGIATTAIKILITGKLKKKKTLSPTAKICCSVEKHPPSPNGCFTS